MLTQEIVKELLNYNPETGELFWRERSIKWFKTERDCKIWNTRFAGKEAFTALDSKGYFRSAILSKEYRVHRIIWLWVFGKWPKGQIDHINHDKKDNRLVNLRDVTHRENHKNQSIAKNNTSGCAGVYFNKQIEKWQAQIMIDRKLVYLGCYDLYEDAVVTRKAAEVKYGFHSNHGNMT